MIKRKIDAALCFYLFSGTSTTLHTILSSFILLVLTFAMVVSMILLEMENNIAALFLVGLTCFSANFRNGLLMFPNISSYKKKLAKIDNKFGAIRLK